MDYHGFALDRPQRGLLCGRGCIALGDLANLRLRGYRIELNTARSRALREIRARQDHEDTSAD